jgi:DNA repair protein SbcC/Rad50
MKFVTLRVDGFGRLADLTIEFGPGLTVVTGPNEAGKSTIVECLLRLLFGFPKRHFTDDLKPFEPWGGGPYRATLAYALDDNRAFEVTRDFARPDVPTETVEADTRRRVQAFSGNKSASPGGAAFGISLDVYRKAAVMRAGDLGDSGNDGAARELSERLAAIVGSAGDASAADAVERLKKFYSEIGARGPNTPLGNAAGEADKANEALRKYREEHERFLATLTQRAELEDEIRDLTARHGRCDAALASVMLRSTRAQINAATEAKASLAIAMERRAGVVSASPDAATRKRDVEAAVEALRMAEQSVADADAWTASRDTDRESLQRSLDAANAALVEKRLSKTRIEAAIEAHEAAAAGRPPISAGILAALEREAETVDAAEGRERTASTSAAIARQRGKPSVAAAVLTAAAGFAALAAGSLEHAVWLDVLAAVLIVVALIAAAAFAKASRNRAEAITAAELASTEAAEQFARASAALAERCRTLGCANVVAVRAARTAQVESERLLAERAAAEEAATLLAGQRDAWQHRVDDFSARFTEQADARRRVGERLAAAQALLDEIGVPAGSLDERISRSRTLFDAGEEAARADAAVAEAHAALERALAGKTLESLDEDAMRYARDAAVGDPGEFADMTQPELEDELRRVDARLGDAKASLEGKMHLIADFDRRNPASAAELEENAALWSDRRFQLEFDRAAAKIAWETIEAIKDIVHADFTPRLNEAVARSAAAITAGRYDRAWIDQSDFSIRVRAPETGGTLDSGVLSTGTIEQLQFALRAALAGVLGSGERMPIMYDDALAHADDARLRAALEQAAAIAREGNQIVFFTQRGDVESLAVSEPDVRIIHLAGPAG